MVDYCLSKQNSYRIVLYHYVSNDKLCVFYNDTVYYNLYKYLTNQIITSCFLCSRRVAKNQR